MPSYEFLDKQGTLILWNKIKSLIGKKIAYESRTAAEWNNDTYYQSEENVLYIYRDYKQINGKKIAAMKIGDGTSYLIDLPFIDQELSQQINNHMMDPVSHITNQEREFWNNKITVSDVVNQETLVLSRN